MRPLRLLVLFLFLNILQNVDVQNPSEIGVDSVSAQKLTVPSENRAYPKSKVVFQQSIFRGCVKDIYFKYFTTYIFLYIYIQFL